MLNIDLIYALLPTSKPMSHILTSNGHKQVNWQANKKWHTTKKTTINWAAEAKREKNHNQFVAVRQMVWCRISVQLCRSVLVLVLSLNMKQSIFIKRNVSAFDRNSTPDPSSAEILILYFIEQTIDLFFII